MEDGNVGSLKGTQAHRGLLRFLIFLRYMKEMIVSFLGILRFMEMLFSGVLPSQCLLCQSPVPSGEDLLLQDLLHGQGGGSEHPVCMLFPRLPLGEGLDTHQYPTRGPKTSHLFLALSPPPQHTYYHKLRPRVNQWFLLIACIGERPSLMLASCIK